MIRNRIIFRPELRVWCLVLLAGILILGPWLFFQGELSQGDHGRDLYAFERTLNGERPYRDYWWVYGPLMPYVFAGFFGLFGIHVSSVLLAQYLFTLAAGLLFYACASRLTRRPTAVIATLWFWVTPSYFFHTYNHTAGLAFLFAVLLAALRFRQSGGRADILLGFLGVFGLCLVKLNIGLGVFLAYGIALSLLRPKGAPFPAKTFFSAGLLTLAVTAGIYAFFLKDLPLYAVRQCMPFFPSDRPFNTSLVESILGYLKVFVLGGTFADIPHLLFRFILMAAIVRLGLLFLRKRSHPSTSGVIRTSAALLVFALVNMHEFFASGVFYRTYWAGGSLTLLGFFLIDRAMAGAPRRLMAAVTLILLCLIGWQAKDVFLFTGRFIGKREHSFGFRRAGIYVGNSPLWIRTVGRTAHFLEENLRPGETFFALPYDPLYYYLLSRKSPTRQLIFFEHINITPKQEREIIRELRRKEIRFILLSSLAFSDQRGNGLFGRDYCPLLAQYIQDNFILTKRFGEWRRQPRWAWPHGTMILERK